MNEKLLHKTLDELGRKSPRMRDLQALVCLGESHAEAFEALGGRLKRIPGQDGSASLEEIFQGMGEGLFLDAFSRADWMVLSGKSGLDALSDWGHVLLEKVLPNMFPRDTRHFLIDLSEAGEKDMAALPASLEVARRLQSHGEATAGFSASTLAIAKENLNGEASGNTGRDLLRVREGVGVSACTLFSEKACGCATREDSEIHDFTGGKSMKDPASVRTAFSTAYAAAALLGISQECQFPLAIAAVECHITKKSNPSWVEIDENIRQKLLKND